MEQRSWGESAVYKLVELNSDQFVYRLIVLDKGDGAMLAHEWEDVRDGLTKPPVQLGFGLPPAAALANGLLKAIAILALPTEDQRREMAMEIGAIPEPITVSGRWLEREAPSSPLDLSPEALLGEEYADDDYAGGDEAPESVDPGSTGSRVPRTSDTEE